MTQDPVTEHSKLTQQEHFEALLFRFVTLYDRISEDRQVGAKLSADTKKLVSHFVDQVNRFEKLTPAVCDSLESSIKMMIARISNDVSQEINHSAFRATEEIARRLKLTVDETQKTLSSCNLQIKNQFFKTILISVGSAIASSLLIVWLLLPKPTLPLSPVQVEAMHYGSVLVKVWPKLSKSEQRHFIKLIDDENGAL